MLLHLRILSVHSFNKSIFLSLGGVGLLMVGFFWVGLALDFTALENAMVGITSKHVVGYEIAVLLGSDARDEIVDKVFRTELAFSILLAFYSVLIFGLAFTKGLFRRLKFLALGVGIPLLSLLLLFWVKFLSDDHIISNGEKTELFLLSIIGVSAGVVLCWFGLVRLSRKTKISLDDFELPSEGSANKPSDDLLDELKERDQGEDGDGIESEQTESPTSAGELPITAETSAEVPEEEKDQPAADTNEEPPEESIEEEVLEAVPELPPEPLSEIKEPEAIEEVVEAQPVVEETEDVPPLPLPEIAEEPPEETVEEEVLEAVPELPPETLSEIEEPEAIEEIAEAQPVVEETEDVPPLPLPGIAEEPPEKTVEEEAAEVVPKPSLKAPLAQPAVTVELLSSEPSDMESSPDIHESANSPPLDHHPVEVEGEEPSAPA